MRNQSILRLDFSRLIKLGLVTEVNAQVSPSGEQVEVLYVPKETGPIFSPNTIDTFEQLGVKGEQIAENLQRSFVSQVMLAAVSD